VGLVLLDNLLLDFLFHDIHLKKIMYYAAKPRNRWVKVFRNKNLLSESRVCGTTVVYYTTMKRLCK
jgi:hypothetical protein